MAKLTTTSYLILGLLATRDWSAYEIAEQVGKGITELWPRAGRQLYNAPKGLVEEGLATARKERNKGRERTVYAITPAGREALHSWFTTPAHPSSLEFEGMIRVVLADQGTIEDLRENLLTMHDQANASRELFARHAAYILATDGGTHPERQHQLALSNRFMVGHFTNIIEWSTWALAEIETWPDTTSPATTHVAQTRAMLERTVDEVPVTDLPAPEQ